jgi:hypothetical protein
MKGVFILIYLIIPGNLFIIYKVIKLLCHHFAPFILVYLGQMGLFTTDNEMIQRFLVQILYQMKYKV